MKNIFSKFGVDFFRTYIHLNLFKIKFHPLNIRIQKLIYGFLKELCKNSFCKWFSLCCNCFPTQTRGVGVCLIFCVTIDVIYSISLAESIDCVYINCSVKICTRVFIPNFKYTSIRKLHLLSLRFFSNV
jgi:hypothetical protein